MGDPWYPGFSFALSKCMQTKLLRLLVYGWLKAHYLIAFSFTLSIAIIYLRSQNDKFHLVILVVSHSRELRFQLQNEGKGPCIA